jgi:CRP-like cAMP-binding protein
MASSSGLNHQELGPVLRARDTGYRTPISIARARPAVNRPAAAIRNRLLNALKSNDLLRLEPELQLVRLRPNHLLAEPGEPMQDIWFPETCIIGLTVYMERGSTAEVGILGCDGMVGYPAALGDRRALAYALVQVPGDALHLPVKAMLAAFESNPGFRNLVLHYIGALHAEVLQSAACHALHSAELRLARLLLMFQDRGSSNGLIPLTHDQLAGMLGVQRTTVTAAAGALQHAGLIAYRHGTIAILDRAGMETAACECYRVIRSHCEHLLPGTCR